MKKSTGIALGVGVGIAALAIGAGAYYIYKQAKKIDEAEDDVEYVYDELDGNPSINNVSLSDEDIDIDVD